MRIFFIIHSAKDIIYIPNYNDRKNPLCVKTMMAFFILLNNIKALVIFAILWYNLRKTKEGNDV